MIRRILNRMLQVFAAGIALGVFAAAFLGYFVFSFDPQTGLVSDGLGRSLEPTPLLAGFIFDADRQWAGWGWFAADFVWFWGGLAVAWKLYEFAERRR